MSRTTFVQDFGHNPRTLLKTEHTRNLSLSLQENVRSPHNHSRMRLTKNVTSENGYSGLISRPTTRTIQIVQRATLRTLKYRHRSFDCSTITDFLCRYASPRCIRLIDILDYECSCSNPAVIWYYNSAKNF